MRARLAKPALLAALGLAALGACGTLDSQDQVHDLRMLALRAEPPEQVFQIPPSVLALLLGTDGGVDTNVPVPDGGLPLFNLPNILPVKVTGLLADPKGNGRKVHYQFLACPALTSDTSRCDPLDADTRRLAEGDTVTSHAAAEVSATLNPNFDLLGAAFQRDPYHGFGFLPVYVQLSISTGDGEKVVGFKRVLYTASLDPTKPPPPPNQNPIIPELTIGGHLWAESEVVTLDQRAAYEVNPLLQSAWEEEYDKPTFDGKSLHFKESWTYNFSATAGTFDDNPTGGVQLLTGITTPSVASHWAPNADDGEQDVTFWVVVRDGRGGETWVQRLAHFAPK